MKSAVLLVLALIHLPSSSLGLDWSGGSLGGVMKQPSSQYMLAVYGGFLDMSTDDRNWRFRGIYLERPKFDANGFSEQEFAGLAYLGTGIGNNKDRGFAIYLGGGEVSGYVAANEPTTTTPMRSYRMRGISAAAAYELRWQHISSAIEHHSFIGFVSRDQVDAYVGWPYSFILLKLGIYL